ncbi:MAG: TatD family hydrolase [Methanobrevibacter sp.]|jgi:TatD DNase family protein|nr:TatD family hydrolase [Methanobrevibacter sp.]
MNNENLMNNENCKYIDIGVNLLHKSFNKDKNEVIKMAESVGVSPLIITGTTESNSLETIKYIDEYNKTHGDKLFSTVGIHPHNAQDFNSQSISNLEKMAKNPYVVAIGECGLDYNRNFSPQDVQRLVFEEQIKLAIKLETPLFLHDRESFPDFSDILEKYIDDIPNFVVHCFTGKKEELEKYLELGAYIGITGWICDERRGQDLLKLINEIPLGNLMIETDAPFLIPRDLNPKPKSHRNSPLYLSHIAETIANELGEDLSKIANITYKNSKKFFNL